MRRRARTCEAPSQQLDMMVLEFGAHESSMMTATGKHNKEMKWRVAALGTEPMEVVVKVDKTPGSAPYVGVHHNTTKLFPTGDKSSAHLKENFEHKWPYRASPQNLDKEDFFEVKPKGSSDWYIASKINQRRDGTFEGSVWLPDEKLGWKLVNLPSILKEDIRQEKDKRPLEIPVREVVLNVSKEKPLTETTLTLLDGGREEEITHFFARVTPPPARGAMEAQPASRELSFQVDKERVNVTTNITHSMLESYMKGELGAVSCKADSKTKMTWCISIGPYAEHTITVERKHKTSREMTLSVDGSVLVNAKARDFDIDYDGDDDESEAGDPPWVCKFYFIGERSLKFKVFEESKGGITLDTTEIVEGIAKENQIFKKACTVSIPNVRDLSESKLDIDGTLYRDLKEPRKKSEDAMHLTVEVLKMQYGIEVPRKIRNDPPPGLAAIQQKWMEGVENIQGAVAAGQTGGFLAGIQSLAAGATGAKGSGKGYSNAQ